MPLGAAPSTGTGQDHAQRFDQSAVASKTARFETVSANSPEVARALKSDDLAGGTQLAGRTGSFTGTVFSVYNSTSSVYVDFAQDWHKALSADLKQANAAKFPDMKSLKGKRVVITGVFSLYDKTHPEIDLLSPSQVKIAM